MVYVDESGGSGKRGPNLGVTPPCALDKRSLGRHPSLAAALWTICQKQAGVGLCPQPAAERTDQQNPKSDQSTFEFSICETEFKHIGEAEGERAGVGTHK